MAGRMGVPGEEIVRPVCPPSESVRPSASNQSGSEMLIVPSSELKPTSSKSSRCGERLEKAASVLRLASCRSTKRVEVSGSVGLGKFRTVSPRLTWDSEPPLSDKPSPATTMIWRALSSDGSAGCVDWVNVRFPEPPVPLMIVTESFALRVEEVISASLLCCKYTKLSAVEASSNSVGVDASSNALSRARVPSPKASMKAPLVERLLSGPPSCPMLNRASSPTVVKKMFPPRAVVSNTGDGSSLYTRLSIFPFRIISRAPGRSVSKSDPPMSMAPPPLRISALVST